MRCQECKRSYELQIFHWHTIGAHSTVSPTRLFAPLTLSSIKNVDLDLANKMKSAYGIIVTLTPCSDLKYVHQMCIHILCFSLYFLSQSETKCNFPINTKRDGNKHFPIHTTCHYTNIDFNIHVAPLFWNNEYSKVK